MFRRSSRVLAGAVCAVGVAFAVGAGAPAANASTTCPSTFAVQHNDRIGSLQLPKGAYQVRVDRITCAQASGLFAAFLNDYDGRLPAAWRSTVRGTGEGLFARSGTRAGAFAVSLTRSRGGGGTRPVSTLVCPSPFRVLNDDQVGLLSLPAGRYRLTRLSALSPACAQLPSLFQTFLQDPDGILPGGWTVLPEDGTFVRGSLSYGFRVEPSACPSRSPPLQRGPRATPVRAGRCAGASPGTAQPR